jgi:serine/threonine-protein kinase
MTDALAVLAFAVADRYRIERELGAGGMATVYLAEDLKHRRKVALKVLRAELAHELGPERFLREIETTAALHHPHILPLYDSGAAGELLYYVMPFIEGESLRDRLTCERQLPIDDALQIAREVSDALSYAHSRGVIHRDIKPENILLEGGHAMVADFGIARAVSAAGNESLTRAGTSIGTPAYMSPEQAAGSRDVDGRSDLYSLGCVVYEMLAGQAPFTGPTVESVIHQHLIAEPRPITQIRPAVPAAIAGVLQRALAKNPADRFSPVAQFADALRGSASQPIPDPSPAVGSSRLRRLMVAGAAVLGFATIAAGVLFATRGRAASDGTPPPSVAVLPFADLSGGANEYLADGMAETLINALSAVPGLSVAARTSAFSFKGRDQDVRAIGETLGVATVLEGSVQRAGERLRITAQLINARDGFHIWSQSFDRNVADVFEVQDEVARAVVQALELKLVGGSSAQVVDHGTDNLEAYNAYLQGLFFWNKRTVADLGRAEAFFKKAIAADSGFARAWAGLASAYVLFTPSEYDVKRYSAVEALALADRAARRALALDARSAEAYTALGAALAQRGELREAAAAFDRAIEINPRYPTGHQWYSTALVKMGRPADALEQMLVAQRLDPLSLIIGVETGLYLALLGRTSDANAQYERMIERHPNTFVLNFNAGLHYLVHSDFDRAAKLLGQLAVDLGADTSAGRRLERALRDSSTRTATLRALTDSSRSPELAPMQTFPEIAIAAHRALGDDVAAIAAFERAVDVGATIERVYLTHALAVLGPDLTAKPRMQAAIQRYIGRLRELRR